MMVRFEVDAFIPPTASLAEDIDVFDGFKALASKDVQRTLNSVVSRPNESVGHFAGPLPQSSLVEVKDIPFAKERPKISGPRYIHSFTSPRPPGCIRLFTVTGSFTLSTRRNPRVDWRCGEVQASLPET
jgi:hypothetical protein